MSETVCSVKGCKEPMHVFVQDGNRKVPLCAKHFNEKIDREESPAEELLRRNTGKLSNYPFGTVVEVPVDQLVASDWNPNSMNPLIRDGKVVFDPQEALFEDMKLNGPNSIAPVEAFPNDDVYSIFDGNHRWLNARKLGWKTIKTVIHDISESEAMALSYRRNRERGTIDPLKEAALFEMEWKNGRGLTQEAIAKKYNVSQSYVAERIGLKKVEEIIPRGIIPELSASALEVVAKAEPKTQKKIVKLLKKGELQPTVQAINEAIKREEFNVDEMTKLARSLILEMTFEPDQVEQIRWLQEKWALSEEETVKKAVSYAYDRLKAEA